MRKRIAALLTAALLLAVSAAGAEPAFRAELWTEPAVEICLDEEAEPVALSPSEAVTAIVLDELVWEGDGVISRTVWTEDALVPGETVVLRAFPGEVIPRFRVTCVNAEGRRERLYLLRSGEDGSLFLTEAAESAPPVVAVGLAETERRAEELRARGDGALAAKELFDLWENERVLIWGGYAQSYAEQRWLAAREEKMRLAEDGGDPAPLALGAEMTREHVRELLGE